jgi:hypothetical protein
MRRVLERRADGVGIEFPEKNQRLGRDAVLAIVAPAGPNAQ